MRLVLMGLGGCVVASGPYEQRLAELEGCETFYEDADADGFGTPDVTILGCDGLPDGYSPAAGDCDDRFSEVNPGRLEVRCNGFDDDCNDETPDCSDDLLDGDGDAYPVVTRLAYSEALVLAGQAASIEDVAWPSTLYEGPADCDDTDADVNPGSGVDAPYDGVDQDCDGSNDFDADGDGQMPPSVDAADVVAYAEALGLTIDVQAATAFGDCNDDDATVYTGAVVDVPYDGDDSDCDGSNDFDLDGDGYIPTELAAAFDAFVAVYHPNPTDRPTWVDAAQLGDCLDDDRAEVTLNAELVYPGAPDAPYDGVDADCAGDSDFDADGDGYTVTGMDAAIDSYRELWSHGDPPGFVPTLLPVDVEPGDCNDTEPSAAPGNLETLGDSVDADCDGQADTTPFGYGNLSWDRPSWPRVVRNANHYLVASRADLAVKYNATGNTTLYAAAPYFTFQANGPLPGYRADPFEIALWANDNPSAVQPLSLGFDLISPLGNYYFAYTFNTPNNDIYKMALIQRTYQALSGSYGSTQLAVATNSFVGYDADLDSVFVPDHPGTASGSGWHVSVACGGSGRDTPTSAPGAPDEPGSEAFVRMQAMRVPFNTGNVVNPIDPSSIGDGTRFLPDNTGDVCWVRAWRADADTVLAEAHVCDVDGCLEFSGEILEDQLPISGQFTQVGTSPYSGRGIIEADVHDDLLITAEDAGLVVESFADGTSMTLFASDVVLSGDAAVHDGILYAVAVVAGTDNQLKLAYGPWDGSTALTVTDVPVEDPSDFYEGGVGCEPATGAGCNQGRILDPIKASIHADADRVVVAVSAVTPDGWVPRSPEAPIGGTSTAAPQDAVGWMFMAPVPPTP